jgi:magnesium transporter
LSRDEGPGYVDAAHTGEDGTVTPTPRNPEDRPVANLLAPDIIAMLDESPGDLATETEEIHPADLAEVAELLERDQLQAFLNALGPARAADVLEYLDEELRTEFLESVTPRQAAELVTQMTPDDRADTLEEIDEDRVEEILSEIPTEARRETEALLAFDPASAGGLMTTEFVSVASEMSVEAALENVRAVARAGKKEVMNVIYATDEQGRVVGVMSLRELLAAPAGAKISDIAWSEVESVGPHADREAVAQVITDYDLIAVPVVSESGHMMGVVTVDDVIDAIQEEQTEDVQKFGGMEALDEPYMQIGLRGMIRKRAGWLSILLVGEMFTSGIIQFFELNLKKAPALIVFIALVMSSGGNSGSQATSLITRAIALREVELRDWWRVALRELPSGLILGTILGVLGLGRVLLWQWLHDHGLPGADYEGHAMLIGLVVGTSLVGIVTFGSLAGSMLPFLLKRVGFDPATASAPLVATLVDASGLAIYFSVAWLLLHGKLL